MCPITGASPAVVSLATTVGDAKDILNATSDRGVDLFYAEFHADFRSGLHFDLGGCISEHKSNFQFEAPMRRFYFFGAFLILFHIFFYFFLSNGFDIA